MEVTIIKFGLFKSRYYFRSGIPVAPALLSSALLRQDLLFDRDLRGAYPAQWAQARPHGGTTVRPQVPDATLIILIT